jgi:hypothetical protein
MYPRETLYREKKPSKQFLFIAEIIYDYLQNIHHKKYVLKELAKFT